MSEKTNFAKRTIDKLTSKEFVRKGLATVLATTAFAACGVERPGATTSPPPTSERSTSTSITPSPVERSIEGPKATKILSERSSRFTTEFAQKLQIQGVDAVPDESEGLPYHRYTFENFSQDELKGSVLKNDESRSVLRATLDDTTKQLEINAMFETSQDHPRKEFKASFTLLPGNPGLATEMVSSHTLTEAVSNPATLRLDRYASYDKDRSIKTIVIEIKDGKPVALDDNEEELPSTDPLVQEMLQEATDPAAFAKFQKSILNP